MHYWSFEPQAAVLSVIYSTVTVYAEDPEGNLGFYICIGSYAQTV